MAGSACANIEQQNHYGLFSSEASLSVTKRFLLRLHVDQLSREGTLLKEHVNVLCSWCTIQLLPLCRQA
jgi:hypothetical protein